MQTANCVPRTENWIVWLLYVSAATFDLYATTGVSSHNVDLFDEFFLRFSAVDLAARSRYDHPLAHPVRLSLCLKRIMNTPLPLRTNRAPPPPPPPPPPPLVVPGQFFVNLVPSSARKTEQCWDWTKAVCLLVLRPSYTLVSKLGTPCDDVGKTGPGRRG